MSFSVKNWIIGFVLLVVVSAIGIHTFMRFDQYTNTQSNTQLSGSVFQIEPSAYMVASDGDLGEADNGNVSAFEVVLRGASLIDPSEYEISYDELSRQANDGDAKAALVLGQRLQGCLRAPPPQTVEQFEAMMVGVRTEYTLPTKIDGVEVNVPINTSNPENVDLVARFAEQQYMDCNHFTVDQRAEFSSWLRIAAEGGAGVEALRAYGSSLPPQQSIAFLESAWHAGDVLALMNLSNSHRYLYENGDRPTGLVESYAAMFAYGMILTEATKGRLDQDVWQKSVDQFRAMSSSVTSKMHEHEIAEAQRMAVSMVKENENCCSHPMFNNFSTN